ncbi:MAG: mechanosensitive ion channel [Bacteroidia bacterium]|nr:mechanosensitive ion channel [Bacteroidia bacterium]
MNEFLQKAKEILNWGIHIGEGEKGIHLTLGIILMLLVALMATNILLRFFRRVVTRKMASEDKLKFVSIFQFIKYAIYVVVVLLTLSAVGVDITLLITASAALFVGLGLALQDLFQDLIGGIYVIVDKTLRVGDIIEVDSRVGRVQEIKLRTTRAVTPDDKVIIIPNHKFIKDTVYNYTQNRLITIEAVRVGVAYGSDVDLVSKLLVKSLDGVEGVLQSPDPFVWFEDFADSSLAFSIRFYVADSFRTNSIKSAIRFNIDSLFREHKIKIPFPQRDIHIISQPKTEN